jgi:hypothetical protein
MDSTKRGFLLITIAVIALGMLNLNPAFADDTYTFIIKKQENKEKYRWNLTDWLNTRDQMRAQDLWLALHSPSPYEFYFGGSYLFPEGSNPVSELFVGGFSSIFGLEARYEAHDLMTHWHGIFNFRFFGYQDQGTNLTLQLGVRNTATDSLSYRNALAGLGITLYFSKYFGFEGLYRYYFTSTPTIDGARFTGERFQGGAFLDFKFLRIYGDYIVNNETTSNLKGVLMGTKIYF